MPRLLRPGLLQGVSILVAGGARAAPAVVARCRDLGASVAVIEVDPLGEPPALRRRPDVLVWDGPSVYSEGVAGARATLDGAWLAIHCATRPQPGEQKIVLLAPPPGSAHAEAVRGGLENLARTTSIEWARFGTRIVTVLGGAADDVAELVAYLSSPAGDYFSGTALTLR